MLRYKLTDANDRTYNNTQWGKHVTHTASGAGALCGAGWIHVYTHPLLALLLNPIHGNFRDPHLWKCECSGECKTDYGLKEGWTSVTTTRRIHVPAITTEQRVRFGILCGKAVYAEPVWNAWADKWLSGEDRSLAAASRAARAASAAAARAAEVAEAAASRAAVDSDDVKWAVASVASRAASPVAADAAYATGTPLDLIAIAIEACGDPK